MNIKFSKYNNTTREIASESITLESLSEMLDKPTKEDKKHLTDAETWAKYAFENEKEYYLTYYKEGIPYACVNNYFMGISIDFLELDDKGDLFNYLTIFYKKYDVWNQNKDGSWNKFSNNQMFFSQIWTCQENDTKRIVNELFFNLKSGMMQWDTNTETLQPEYKMEYEERETKVNMDQNWVRFPKHYKDYEYLLDYQNIIKPEYLDLLPEDKKDKPLFLSEKDTLVYKTFKGKSYTKDEWEAYEKEQWEKYKGKK